MFTPVSVGADTLVATLIPLHLKEQFQSALEGRRVASTSQWVEFENQRKAVRELNFNSTLNASLERIAAVIESESRKRQELEDRLAVESKERERLASETMERERLFAEAQERERQQAQAPQPQRQETISRLERRVALLVGNGAYKQSPLDNAVNDATDLNAALKSLGFQTILLQNSSLQMMKQKTREFADLAINADVALIFYSGHGIEYRGNNYLIPTSTGSLMLAPIEN